MSSEVSSRNASLERRDASTADVRIRSSGRIEIRYRGTKEWIDTNTTVDQLRGKSLGRTPSAKPMTQRHVTHHTHHTHRQHHTHQAHHAKHKPASESRAVVASSAPVVPEIRDKPFYTKAEVNRIMHDHPGYKIIYENGGNAYLRTPKCHILLGRGDSLEEVLMNDMGVYPVQEPGETHDSSSTCGSVLLDGLFATLRFMGNLFYCVFLGCWTARHHH